VAVVVFFSKSETRKNKGKQKAGKQEKPPYSMQHLVPKMPVTNIIYDFY
jgi:hypothetical protein